MCCFGKAFAVEGVQGKSGSCEAAQKARFFVQKSLEFLSSCNCKKKEKEKKTEFEHTKADNFVVQNAQSKPEQAEVSASQWRDPYLSQWTHDLVPAFVCLCLRFATGEFSSVDNSSYIPPSLSHYTTHQHFKRFGKTNIALI